ncbi:TPA: hypothetical protein O2C02_002706 [Staphylococcus aureus]|uniref:hypothetical protein n=2 Tax=Staphylococcus aureus TaxID=1280 RepID=UPI0005DE2D42|nr:hypothetical protein [Staphylococcus aureus]MBD6796962.1 hypothetical protein [Staphylococcus aureus]MCQ1135572.1 hypothetical protein [Staphylococcus aureus]QHK36049.1 hypothetical protein E3T14_14665 [Staphylococcus aureus]UCJ79348.1 hypothetical protein KU507_14370 [Staphylococcus aureus]UCJ79376.1 hypothetical protein KU507_14615 [Staphylococcus aureus]
MKEPYNNIMKLLKTHYHWIANSQDPSTLNNDDMTWATRFRDILMLLEKEKITIEEAIEYLDKAIQKNADEYKNEYL